MAMRKSDPTFLTAPITDADVEIIDLAVFYGIKLCVLFNAKPYIYIYIYKNRI